MGCQMELDPGPLTIGPHRRIELQNCHVDRLDLAPSLKKPLTNGPSQMLHKIDGGRHHLGHQLVNLGIVDGVIHLVTKDSAADIDFQTQADFIIITYKTLLRLHAMKGMETQGTQEYIT